MPRISVILPVYNGEEACKKTIESVLEQSFKDFELLAVNDGSSDGTPEVLKRFALSDPRVIILDNLTNKGIVHSLNRGLELAGGDYIARIDSGDVCVPGRLQEQYDFLESHREYVLVGSKAWLADEEDHILGVWEYPAHNDQEIRRMLYLRVNPLIHPSVMYRRVSGMYYDPLFEYGEDHEMWFRLGLYGKFANLAKPLIYYRLHEGISWRKRAHQILLSKLGRQKLNAALDNRKLPAECIIRAKDKYLNNIKAQRASEKYVRRHSKSRHYRLKKNLLLYMAWKAVSIILYPMMLLRLIDTLVTALFLPVNRHYRRWRSGYPNPIRKENSI